MNKKVKIIGSLSLITIALASGAQIYTNHKIDQILQQFPYSLRDKISLNVIEQKKTFFSREFTFTLNDEETSATSKEIIHTKLTALPFAIIADSQLVSSFVKELNKNLKVTIDKNSITSKFSVIGDYFQSNINTQFRDLTNKAQTLIIDLNFEPKNKLMDIQSQLTGFNFDAHSKANDLTANATLVPISDNQYDIKNINIQLKNGEISLPNGTNINLEKTNYSLNKSFSGNTYDLATDISADNITITEKHTAPTLNLKELELSLSQKAIPNHLSYSHFFNQLKDENNLKNDDIINQGLDLLFLNKESELNVKLTNVSLKSTEKQFDSSVDNLTIKFKGNFENLSQTELLSSLNLKELNYLDNENSFYIKGLMLDTAQKNINVDKKIDLLKETLTLFKTDKLSSDIKWKDKDNVTFIETLKELAKTYNEEQNSILKIDELSLSQDIELKGVTLNLNDKMLENDSYSGALEFSIDSYLNKPQKFQLNNGKLVLPLKMANTSSIIPTDICTNQLYSYACIKNLSFKTYADLIIYQPFKLLTLDIEQATLNGEIDTYPSSFNTPFNGTMMLKIGTLEDQESKDASLLALAKLDKTDFNFSFSFANGLFKNDILSDKSSSEWELLTQWIMPEGELTPYLKENGDNYTLQFRKEGEKYWLNNEPFNPNLLLDSENSHSQ